MASEAILVGNVTQLLKKLVSVISQEIDPTLGVIGALKKLQNTLEMIAAVTDDAETKQVNDEAVRLWLKKLKDVAYDADDLLDDFSYEVMRRNEMDSLKYKVRHFVSSSNPLAFRFKMANRIKRISKKLDEIANDNVTFQLQTNARTSAHQSSEQWNQQTLPFVEDLEIVGRDNDKSKIVDLLLTSSSSPTVICNQYENISVISIVGTGGLGKTTLAQQVYKDYLVKKHFEERIWTCVSKEFDFSGLLRRIIECITETKWNRNVHISVLVNRVQIKLKGKRFLLVLDDLSNENVDEWERLRSLLTIGAQGSRILVTTRKDRVASIIQGTISPYHLKKLPQDKCWSIIKQKAFSHGGALETPYMIEIGKEIAEKCGGLPLAARTLGGLMYSKKEECEWVSIRRHGVWKIPEDQSKIRHILKLSYDHLPSHLKQCFSYCSLFPKDWDFDRETLIRLWMAEGFLHTSDKGTNKSMEDIGNEYFESLLSSSFFQDVPMKDELTDVRQYKMHDLVHDLAIIVAGNHESSILNENDEIENISEVRRLAFDKSISPFTFPLAIYNTKTLRTIVCCRPGNYMEIDGFFSNKHLRVLKVGGSRIKKLPASIAKVRHLRYLDLSWSPHLYTLHDHHFINSLYNLQTLVLHNCSSLYTLSRDLRPLKNVRHLDISKTGISSLPDSICNLYNLRTLNLSGCNLIVALPRNVGALKNLTFLDISHTSIGLLHDDITSLTNLRTLKLSFCPNIRSLPTDFGALKSLSWLDLLGTNIEVLPESCTNLNNLEMVKQGNCRLPKEIGNWKKLRHLTHIRTGDEMPRGIARLTCLQTLQSYIVRKEVTGEPDCGGIEELEGLNILRELKICDLKNVRSGIDAHKANLKQKQNISLLELDWDLSQFGDRTWNHDTMVLQALQSHPNLEILKINHFMGLKLPTWMGVSSCLPNLLELHLNSCDKCNQLPALGQLPFLRVLTISTFPSLKDLDYELYRGAESSNTQETTAAAFPSLIELTIGHMDNLEKWIAPLFPHSFLRLRKMEIYFCHKLTITPTLSFLSLKGLELRNINIKAVSSILQNNLTSLTSLSISNIPGLDGKAVCSMIRGLSSLTLLYLSHLPELTFFQPGILHHKNNDLLQHLKIEKCYNFQGFRIDGDNDEDEDEVLPSIPSLQNNSPRSLEIRDCPALTFLPDVRGWKIIPAAIMNPPIIITQKYSYWCSLDDDD